MAELILSRTSQWQQLVVFWNAPEMIHVLIRRIISWIKSVACKLGQQPAIKLEMTTYESSLEAESISTSTYITPLNIDYQ